MSYIALLASRVAPIGVGVAMALVTIPVPASADAPSPLYALVDAAAQRLETAQPVAASKWTTGGSISDPARETQVIDSVTAAARERDVDADYVRRVFRDQIDATVGVEYAYFSGWKLDPASAPTTAPDLSNSRSAIDGYNRTMVNEIAAQRNSLHSPACTNDLEAARAAVVADRALDDLYQRGLTFATRSYCG
ncbi:chorismate mutase [Mycobacterium yunnanensis]|uniref:Chorismate mutase n=1 Tax=Mycobacterium yunnanensis TaxID=368477 RepID=A0A9X2YZA9_9MYCO|nr:chorismate mutase [Mycobacterium yunnanensis]MCV7419537.1 chorismate mutase [Mycobacterium yunnanensis]